MHGNLPRWVAHRGGGALAPENTLAGIRLAARLGFAAVEFDVMLSGDGTPVLMHDETLERTTNGRGRVADTADAELFALNAGNCEPVPRLAEAAALCRHYGLLANVEIKPSAGLDRKTALVVVQEVVALWQGATVPPLISSFSMEALEIARDLAPWIARGMLVERIPHNWHDELRRLGAATLHCSAGLLTDEAMTAVRAAGVPLLCYTVNERDEAGRLFASGAAALFTDRLDLFVRDTSTYKGLHLTG